MLSSSSSKVTKTATRWDQSQESWAQSKVLSDVIAAGYPADAQGWTPAAHSAYAQPGGYEDQYWDDAGSYNASGYGDSGYDTYVEPDSGDPSQPGAEDAALGA